MNLVPGVCDVDNISVWKVYVSGTPGSGEGAPSSDWWTCEKVTHSLDYILDDAARTTSRDDVLFPEMLRHEIDEGGHADIQFPRLPIAWGSLVNGNDVRHILPRVEHKAHSTTCRVQSERRLIGDVQSKFRAGTPSFSNATSAMSGGSRQSLLESGNEVCGTSWPENPALIVSETPWWARSPLR